MYKKKNPIDKDYKFVAEQYIHNVLTAVRNDHKLNVSSSISGLNVMPLSER